MSKNTTAFSWGRCLAASTAVVSLFCVTLAHAELADKDKPMNIEADSLRYDDATQTSVFSGNVAITKGTIVMRGEKIEVRQDADGNQYGELVGSEKTPSFFRQKREGVDEWIEGEGTRVDYDGKNQVVVFAGKATLRRYRGSLLNDESVGSEITYNSLTEVFTVKGGPKNSSATNPNGRVRAMLTPIPKDDSAPVAPAASPAKLLPTSKIGEKRK